MIFKKVIKGKIKSFSSSKEIVVHGTCCAMEDDEFLDDDYKIHRRNAFYDEYCIEYEGVKVQYMVNGMNYETILEKVYSKKQLMKEDTIKLLYSCVKKSVIDVLE